MIGTTSENAWLSLGANLGDPVATIQRAFKQIEQIEGVEPVSASRLYRTAPVGYRDQPPFINQVIKVSTTLLPRELIKKLNAIEDLLGRLDRPRWHEREIDIDILMYGSLVFSGDLLTIPHARMAERSFVLDPLSEIDPDLVHPVLNRTIRDLCTTLQRDPEDWIEPLDTTESVEEGLE